MLVRCAPEDDGYSGGGGQSGGGDDEAGECFFSHFPLSGQTDTLLNYELACKNKPLQPVVRSYFQSA